MRRYRQPLRATLTAPALPLPRRPSGEVTRWITSHPGHLTENETAKLAKIKARSPQLNATAGHVTALAEMMTGRHHERLPAWITAVERDDLPCLHSFTGGIRRDQPAVANGLSLVYSGGTSEGTICRVKALKTPDVRPRQPRPPAKENPAQHIGTTYRVTSSRSLCQSQFLMSVDSR